MLKGSVKLYWIVHYYSEENGEVLNDEEEELFVSDNEDEDIELVFVVSFNIKLVFINLYFLWLFGVVRDLRVNIELNVAINWLIY